MRATFGGTNQMPSIAVVTCYTLRDECLLLFLQR